MATYDLWVLLLVTPALWWLMGMVRAVMEVRAKGTDEFVGPPTSEPT
jgi:hypothetical protein